MIRKGVQRFSEKIHAQTKIQGAVVIDPDHIALLTWLTCP
jgi:hypothetical protein